MTEEEENQELERRIADGACYLLVALFTALIVLALHFRP